MFKRELLLISCWFSKVNNRAIDNKVVDSRGAGYLKHGKEQVLLALLT